MTGWGAALPAHRVRRADRLAHNGWEARGGATGSEPLRHADISSLVRPKSGVHEDPIIIGPPHHWSTPDGRSSRSTQSQSAWGEELSEDPSIHPSASACWTLLGSQQVAHPCTENGAFSGTYGCLANASGCGVVTTHKKGLGAASTSCGLGIVIRHVDRKMFSDRASPSWLVPNHLWSRRACAADVHL